MDYLNLIGNGIAYFFKNLPQYAAILTASVAVSLFLIKEHKEKKKKKNDEKKEGIRKERELHAIRSVIAKEAFSLIEQVVFFIELHEKVKDAVRVRVQIMPDNMWRQMYIGYEGEDLYSSYIMIPNSPVCFDHSFAVSAINAEPKLYEHINKLNTAINVMCKSVDSCIGFSLENDTDSVKRVAYVIVNGNMDNDCNIARNAIKSISEFSKELSALKRFTVVSKKIKSAIGIDLEN